VLARDTCIHGDELGKSENDRQQIVEIMGANRSYEVSSG
jgi:hypothetical protein